MKAEITIKKQTREILAKGNLPCAVGVITLLCVAVMTCFYLSNLLTDALTFGLTALNVHDLTETPMLYNAIIIALFVGALVLTLPLFMGAVRFFYTLAKTEECCFSESFYYLSKGKYLDSMGKLLRIVFKGCWKTIISFLPGVLILLTAVAASAEKDNLDFYNILWYSISYAMIIAGLYLFCFLSADKFLAVYLMIEDETLTAKAALSISEHTMQGYEKSLPKLLFLYLPFLVLCLAVIPLLFVIPYIMTSCGVSAKWLIQLPKLQNEVE